MPSGQRSPGLSGYLFRLAPLGTFTGLGTMAVVLPPEPNLFLAGLFGIGAAYTGRQLLDRRGNRRKGPRPRAREDVRGLGTVAPPDRLPAPQM